MTSEEEFYLELEKRKLRFTELDDCMTRHLDCLIETIDKPYFAVSFRISYEETANHVMLQRFGDAYDIIRSWREKTT